MADMVAGFFGNQDLPSPMNDRAMLVAAVVRQCEALLVDKSGATSAPQDEEECAQTADCVKLSANTMSMLPDLLQALLLGGLATPIDA